MGKYAIEVENVGMKFNMSSEKVDDLKDYVIKLLKRQLNYKEFWALKDISFKIEKGDRVGLVGLNGAGKVLFLRLSQEYLSRQKEKLRYRVILHLFWSLVPGLINSIRAQRIYFFMVLCLGILRLF